MAYNLLTCSGFEGVQKAGVLSPVAGGCMKARLMLVVLFFLIAIIRKWGAEEWGIEFNFWIALALGLGLYLLLTTITGNLGISLVVGIGSSLIGGYGAGYFLGGTGENRGGGYE